MAPGQIRQRIDSDDSREEDNVAAVEHLSNGSGEDREPEGNFVIIIYDKIATKSGMGILFFFLGWLLNFLTVKVLILINLASGDVSPWVSVLYLLFERPLFVLGATMQILPFLLRTPVLRPITNLMASSVWYPLARLSYGAYLCHGMFMLFRTYNTEKGIFASEFDAFLFFFAYITFAFIFSFFATVFIEIPCLRLIDTFIVR